MRPALLCLLALVALGCAENPFERPATVVDGTGFPDELRGAIAPHRAYRGGEAVSLYLLGPATGAVGEVIRAGSAGARPPCLTGQRNAGGAFVEPDLAACQGFIFSSLPGQPGYTPFLRVREAPASRGDARSRAEAGSALTTTGEVVDLTVIDPQAVFADATGATARAIGWYETLEVVHLVLAGSLPVAGERVVPMDLLVPEGMQPGEGDDRVPARPGEPGYSTLCNVVFFRAEARMQPDPPITLHCVVR